MDFTTRKLVALLGKSRANNKASGITGMLLFRGGNFMQVLEGSPDALGATLERIRRDPRHHDITVIGDFMVPQRSFADYQMGFAHLDDPEVTKVPGFTEFLGNDFHAPAVMANPSFAMTMLRHFKDYTR